MPVLLGKLSAFQCPSNLNEGNLIEVLTFRTTITELASRQLMAHRGKIQEICSTCFPVLMKLWESAHQGIINLLKNPSCFQDSKSKILIEVNINLQKSLRRISKRLLQSEVHQLLKSVLCAQKSYFEALPVIAELQLNIKENYLKMFSSLSKISLEIVDNTCPVENLGSLLDEVILFCRKCIILASENREFVPNKFLVNSMNQIKKVVQDMTTPQNSSSDNKELRPTISLYDDHIRQLAG